MKVSSERQVHTTVELLLWEAIEEVLGSGAVMKIEDYLIDKRKDDG